MPKKAENPWADFERSVEEDDVLPPMTIKGETFVFPKEPPAIFGTKMLALQEKHGELLPYPAILVLVRDEVIGVEEWERLERVLSGKRIAELVGRLLEQWRMVKADEEEKPAPNRQARRKAGQRSRSPRGSSATGQRSEPTSRSSTG